MILEIDLTLIEIAMGLSEAFFDLSKSEKNKIRRTTNNGWGYYDEELTKNRQDW